LLPGAQIWFPVQQTPLQAATPAGQQRFACGSAHWKPGLHEKNFCGDVDVLQQAPPAGAQ
jgi:hypothetical protein